MHLFFIQILLLITINDLTGYKLVWEDSFNAYDKKRWIKKEHTFQKNLAQFRKNNVKIKNGVLLLQLKSKSRGKKYSGAEIRTREAFRYGLFEVRMRPCRVSGAISSFFSYSPEERVYNEIDIEFFGKNDSLLTINYWSDRYDNNGKDITLPFDPYENFHTYAIEWQKDFIRWYIDGKMIYETRENVPQEKQYLIMNLWIREKTAESGLPCFAEYDYVRYYSR